jgi:hypothetical protein
VRDVVAFAGVGRGRPATFVGADEDAGLRREEGELSTRKERRGLSGTTGKRGTKKEGDETDISGDEHGGRLLEPNVEGVW